MYKILLLTTSVALTSFAANADQRFYGSWVDNSSGLQLDILDGFKPNRGPVLVVAEDGEVSSKTWSNEGGAFEISIDYQSYAASIGDDGSLVLSQSYGDPLIFSAITGDAETAAVSLKDDENAFVSKLQDFIWLTSTDGTIATFKATFGTDTGVVELTKDERLNDLKGWGVSSGVIKIGSSVVVEARVTNQYFVGLDQRDNFVVYKSLGDASQQVTTDVETQREQFFNAFLTGEWETTSWGSTYLHKFRPIYGELAGEAFTVFEGRLYSDREWEYSPATGALKIGSTEYVGALIVNDTLALIEKDGDQKFYNRLNNGNDKRYTLGDVKTVALSENSLAKVAEMLSPQFQRDDYLYSFEFKGDGRTGFTHQWRSTPFNITGETFETKLIGESERLFQVEDFVIFEGEEVFKMDTSESRLKPKTDAEAKSDVAAQEQLQQNAQMKSVKVRVMTVDGETVDVVLPVTDFASIASVSILTE